MVVVQVTEGVIYFFVSCFLELNAARCPAAMAGGRLSGAAIALLLAIVFNHGGISQAQFQCFAPPCLVLFEQAQLRDIFEIDADQPTSRSLITYTGPSVVIPSQGSSIVTLTAEISSSGGLLNAAAETVDLVGAQKTERINNDSVTISFSNFGDSANDVIQSLQFTLKLTNHLFTMPGFEYQEVREIRFQANDSTGRVSNFQIAEIRLNNPNTDTPVFSANSYEGSVDENAIPGTVVSFTQAITVSDSDGVTYSLGSGVGLEGVFTINSTTGEITVVDSSTLDREDPNFGGIVSFSVTATDNHLFGNAATAQVSVIVDNVNDNPPVFTQTNYEIEIEEELPPPFTLSLQLVATDPDNRINDPIVYDLEPDDIPGLNDRFAVSEMGVITLLRRTDFETDPQTYVFRVRATDLQLPAATATVTVTITNINDNRPQIAIGGLSTVYVDLTVRPPENGTFLLRQFSILDDSDQLKEGHIQIKPPVSETWFACECC